MAELGPPCTHACGCVTAWDTAADGAVLLRRCAWHRTDAAGPARAHAVAHLCGCVTGDPGLGFAPPVVMCAVHGAMTGAASPGSRPGGPDRPVVGPSTPSPVVGDHRVTGSRQAPPNALPDGFPRQGRHHLVPDRDREFPRPQFSNVRLTVAEGPPLADIYLDTDRRPGRLSMLVGVFGVLEFGEAVRPLLIDHFRRIADLLEREGG